jgi:hypothetical protein
MAGAPSLVTARRAPAIPNPFPLELMGSGPQAQRGIEGGGAPSWGFGGKAPNQLP